MELKGVEKISLDQKSFRGNRRLSELLKRKEAAKYLNVGKAKFDRLVKAGEIFYAQIGKQKMFKRTELERYVETNTKKD